MDQFAVKVKSGKKCEKILSVSLDAEKVEKEFDAFYKQVSKKAKIPGFRQGKIPRKVLEMHFGENAKSEVLNQLLNESIQSAMIQEKIQPVSAPEVKDVKFENYDLSYEASVEVRPAVKLSKIKGLSGKKPKSEVTDKDVAESLERLRESFAKHKAIEDRPSKIGDVLIVDYVCTADGREVEKREGDWIELKDKEYLKGFSKQLVGLKSGDAKDVKVTFPKDAADKTIQGKKAIFAVKVLELKSKELPELNDDLVKEMGGEVNTLDEMKVKVREELETQKKQQANAAYEKSLLDDLKKHNKFDLPERLVARQLEGLLNETKENLKKQGLGEEEFEKRKGEYEKQLADEARQRVHLAFLFDEIAKVESIKVEDSDLQVKYDEVAKQVGQPAEQVKEFYSKNREMESNLFEQIRNEKVMTFLKDQAKGK